MNPVRQSAAAALALGLTLFITGCASPEDHGIPTTATLAMQGMGPLTFTAPDNGLAYVYDNADDFILWSGPVRRGQTINIDSDNHRVLVDNRVASDKTVISGHRY